MLGRVIAAKNGRTIGKTMRREELEALRAKVSCEIILQTRGWEIDSKESTRRAVKYRRAANIIIVTHGGRGWFDPLSDNKGDVFGLAMILDGSTFPSAAGSVAAAVGRVLSRSETTVHDSEQVPMALDVRWQARHVPDTRSGSWQYLCWSRRIPPAIVRFAIGQDILREGPYGSMWAAHLGNDGHVAGWEERGVDWRGFATGGSKVLFRIGAGSATRLCVTEAAIDAMSLAALEGMRENTLYLSTGGGWSPATDAALVELAARPGAQLVAATDANSQGEVYADRLRAVAERSGCSWQRLRPPADDWNEAVKARARERTKGWKGKNKTCAAYAPSASREASPGTRPALDVGGHEVGKAEGLIKD